MPVGPNDEKRPAGAIGNAVHVMKVAAVKLGRKGGARRAEVLDLKWRFEIADLAARS